MILSGLRNIKCEDLCDLFEEKKDSVLCFAVCGKYFMSESGWRFHT